tara:strand:+ start:304 stop:696 length:393 start_codon:yes stop_codon:yes gene_type:complete
MWVGDFDKIKAASRAAKYYLEELESRLKSMEVDVVYKPLKWEIRPVEEIKRNVEVLDRFLNDAFTNSFGSVELKNRYQPPTPWEYEDEFTRRFAETFASEGEVKKNSNLTELFFGGLIVSLLTWAAMKRE